MTCPLWKGSLRWCHVCSGLTFKIMFLSHVPGLDVPAVKRVTKPFQGMRFCICHEWKGSRSCLGSVFGMCPQWKGSLSLWRKAVCQQTLGENTIAYIFNSDSCKKLTPIAFRRQEYQILSKIGKIDGIYMNKVSVLSYLFSANSYGNPWSGRSEWVVWILHNCWTYVLNLSQAIVQP